MQDQPVASDAFLPFPDTLEVAAKAGATALVQPGGSIRDKEVIEAANRLQHRYGLYRHQIFQALIILWYFIVLSPIFG